MLKEKEATQIIDQVIDLTSDMESETIIYWSKSDTTRFSDSVITQHLSQQNMEVSIALRKDNKVGKYELNQSDPDTLKMAIAKAKENLSFQNPIDHLLPLTEKQSYQAKDGYYEHIGHLKPTDKVSWLQKAIDKANKEKMNVAGIISNEESIVAFGNSKGCKAYHPSSIITVDLSFTGEHMEGWASQFSNRLSNINLDEIIDHGIDITRRNKNPESIKPGKYDVILTSEALADLMVFLGYVAFPTKNILDGASYLSGKLGKKVFSEILTIEENVFHKNAIGTPFDYEGMPRKSITLVENGVFKDMILDRKYAQKLQKESTGNSIPQPNTRGPYPFNLVIKEGKTTIEEMIASTKHGLFVNRFHYTNVRNPMDITLTGMTRDGLFLIENGKITKPVKNLRYTQSLSEAFNQIEAVSNQLKNTSAFFGGGFLLPAMKINQFNFTSSTEF